MRVEITAGNGDYFGIRTRNQETLARWLIETIQEAELSPHFPAQMRVWPTTDTNGQPDWIADSRVLGRSMPITRGQDVILYLKDQLEQAENLRS